MANRLAQLIALTPRGSFYDASGVILPLRSSPYDFLFAPVTASRTFAVYVNGQFRGNVTSDVSGQATISVVLPQGKVTIAIVDSVTQASFYAYATVRLSVTIQAAHADVISTLDANLDDIEASLSIDTATTAYVSDAYGRGVGQPNDLGWTTETYRRMVRWLRQAFRLFASKLTGLRQAVFSYTSSLPFRVPRAWRPQWYLGYQFAANGDMQTRARVTASPLTNLNARSLNYVHALYLDNGAASFPGPFANPPVAQPLQVRFTVGWAGGSVTPVGVDGTGAAVSEVFTPVAAQPLAVAETVVGVREFATVTSSTKSAVGAGAGSASIGVATSRFLTITDISDYNVIGAVALDYLTAPDRLRWGGATSTAIAIPTSGSYTLATVDLVRTFFGLVPSPGGNYAVNNEHFLALEADDLGIVVVDLSNTLFGGGASPRTQAQIATSINTYFERDTRYGALRATGTITCVSGRRIEAVDAGDVGSVQITISDGLNPAVVFGFKRVGVIGGAVITITYTNAMSSATIASQLVAAIMSVGAALRVSAGKLTTLNSGLGNGGTDNITAPTLTIQTLNVAAAVPATGLVGQSITIGEAANPTNNGTFVITGSTTSSISYVNAAGVIEAAFNGTWSVPPPIAQLQNDFGGTAGNVVITQVGGAGFVLAGMAGGALGAAYSGFASAVAGAFSNALRLQRLGGGPLGTASSIRIHPIGADAALAVLGEPIVSSTLSAGAAARAVLLDLPVGTRFQRFVENVVLHAAFLDTVLQVTSSFTQPTHPVAVQFYFSAAWHGGGLRVTGTALGGAVLSDTITPPSAVVVSGLAASSADGITITGGDFSAVRPGMFFRRSTDSVGSFVQYVDTTTQIRVESAIAGFPWGPVAWTVTRDQTVVGSVAFATITQIDALAISVAGTSGTATLTVIDGQLYGYDVRVGRSLRTNGVGGVGVTIALLDSSGTTATFTAGTLVTATSDQGGYLLIQGATADGGSNNGLHLVFSAPVGGLTSFFVRHGEADSGGRFAPETLPGGATWRVYSAGEIVRVVGLSVASGDLTLYPPGLSMTRAAGALVELLSMPVEARGFASPRTITVTVDRAMLPAAGTGDSLTLAGTVVPDGWRLLNGTGATLDLPGVFGTARWQMQATGVDTDGIGTSDMVLTTTLDVGTVMTYRGFLLRFSFWVQQHFTLVTASFRIDVSFDGTTYATCAAVPGSTSASPEPVGPTMLQGVGSGGVLDPHLVQGQLEVPYTATTCIIRLRLVGAAATNTISLEKCAVTAPITSGLYLGDNTVPMSAHRASFGELLYLWSPEALTATELADLGVPTYPAAQPTVPGTIDRVVNAHGLWDRYNVTEYSGTTPVNVRGVYTDADWLLATLTNMALTIGTPPRVSLVAPTAVSLVSREQLSFSAPSNATLTNTTSHAGPYPEVSYAEEILFENGTPVPATAQVTGGVLPWRYVAANQIQVASVAAGDPAAQAVYNPAAVYTLDYRRLIRAETPAFDLGAGFADYIWIVDLPLYLRTSPSSTPFAAVQQLTFLSDLRGTLDVPSDEDQSTSTLTRDNGITKTILPSSAWRYVTSSVVVVNASEFDPNSIFVLSYNALLPAYPKPVSVVLENRSSAVSPADVLLQTYTTVAANDIVNRANRYQQLRATFSGVVDIRDLALLGLGLRGLHIYGSAPYAPGILIP